MSDTTPALLAAHIRARLAKSTLDSPAINISKAGWEMILGLLDRSATLNHERDGYRRHLDLCEQIAGKALGYPWYKDDQVNFPGATEADGVCIGEHVGDTIVAELANTYEAVRAERDQLKSEPTW